MQAQVDDNICSHCYAKNSLEHDFEFGGGNLVCNQCGYYTTPIENKIPPSFDETKVKYIQTSHCNGEIVYRNVIDTLVAEGLIEYSDILNFNLSILGDQDNCIEEVENINALFKGSLQRCKAILLFYLHYYFYNRDIKKLDINLACKKIGVPYQMFSALVRLSGKSFVVPTTGRVSSACSVYQINNKLIIDKLKTIEKHVTFYSNIDEIAESILEFYKGITFIDSEKNKLCYSFYMVLTSRKSTMISKMKLCQCTDLSNIPTLSRIIKQQTK